MCVCCPRRRINIHHHRIPTPVKLYSFRVDRSHPHSLWEWWKTQGHRLVLKNIHSTLTYKYVIIIRECLCLCVCVCVTRVVRAHYYNIAAEFCKVVFLVVTVCLKGDGVFFVLERGSRLKECCDFVYAMVRKIDPVPVPVTCSAPDCPPKLMPRPTVLIYR